MLGTISRKSENKKVIFFCSWGGGAGGKNHATDLSELSYLFFDRTISGVREQLQKRADRSANAATLVQQR